MINCNDLSKVFKKNDLTFFTGVPDSTFKDWMEFLADGNGLKNVIACNECEAAAISAGYHLVTGKIGVVYMQNSGLGKIVNPATSLLDKEVYSIPTIFMIGWRGEPNDLKGDEPQHKKMGRVMVPLLDVLEIPYGIMPDNIGDAEKLIFEMKNRAENNQSPVALVIKKKTFEEYVAQNKIETNYEMSREDAIKIVVDNINGNEAIVSTTGKTSRELFEYRVARGEKPRDFYTVGSMGCSSAIALGIALHDDKPVYVFDGDGAVLMQMGTLGTIGAYKPGNLQHIIFDNGSHDSTGGQPTVSTYVNFEQIALACGYNSAQTIYTKQELKDSIKILKERMGPNLLIVKVNKGARKNLGRPTTMPVENKEAFMEFFKK